MPPHYSPSTEYIALFLSLPVVFYLGSISTYSKFTAFKLCPLPSTKAETKATPPLPPAKTIRSNGLRTVAIQCATWVVMFVGMRKIPANVWDTLLLGFMWFFLTFVNRSCVGWEVETMAKTSEGFLWLGTIPNTWRTYLLTLLPSLGLVALYISYAPYLSPLVFIPVSTMFASLLLAGTVSLRWMIYVMLLSEVFSVAIVGLAAAIFTSDAGKAALSKLGDVVDNGSKPVPPEDHDSSIIQSFNVFPLWFMFGLLGNLLSVLYRMDRQLAEKRAGVIELSGEVERLERLPPLEVREGQQPTGDRLVLLPLRKVLVNEIASSSIGDLVRFGYAKLAVGAVLVSLAVAPWLLSMQADDAEFVAQWACVLLAPLLISMVVSAAALWRGEFTHVWNYREMWSTEVDAVKNKLDGKVDEKPALIAEDED